MEHNTDNRQNKGKKSKIIFALVLAVAILVSFVGGYFSFYLINGRTAFVAAEVSRIMKNVGYVVDPVTGEMRELTDEDIADALVNSFLDDYSDYYTAEEYRKIKAEGKGRYDGVGLSFFSLSTEIGKVTLNSPADKSGLQKGDVVLCGNSYGQEKIDFKTSEEVYNFLVAAPSEKQITLTVVRGGEQKDFSFYKSEYKASYVTYYDSQTVLRFRSEEPNGKLIAQSEKIENVLGLGDDTAYIRLEQFEGDAADQVENALEFMEKQGRTKLILDLRDNGGGYVNIMSDIAAMLIRNDGKGNMVVASYEGKNKSGVFKSGAYNFFEHLTAISVIANERSASASECLIGALISYGDIFSEDRLVIEKNSQGVAKTYGKGIMQTTYRLISGGAFKLTTARILWPNGNCIHGKGIYTSEINSVDSADAIIRAEQTLG